MRTLRHALWPGGLALGVAAEWAAYDGDAALTVADGLVGFGLIAAGLVTWGRRAESGFGPIATAAGFAWFLGTFGGWALYLHRGVFAHLILSYPSGHVRSQLERAAIAAGYAYAAIYPIAANDYATLGFAATIVAVSVRRYAVAGGPERRARASAVCAALAFASALTLGADERSGEALVSRIREEIGAIDVAGGIPVSASIGVASCPPSAILEDAVELADERLYQEKTAAERRRRTA